MPRSVLSVATPPETIVVAATASWLFGDVSMATTVRITLPSVTVTWSTQRGSSQPSLARSAPLIRSWSPVYASRVMSTLSTTVTLGRDTTCSDAPGGRGGGVDGLGGGGEGLGGGGSGLSLRDEQTYFLSHGMQIQRITFVQEQEAPIARGPLSSVSCPPSYTPYPSRCPSYPP